MLRFFILLSATAVFHAQASTPNEILSLTRTEAIEFAQAQNYDLQVARYSIERAEAASSDAGILPNPEIGMSGISDFAFKNEGEYTWSASLTQKFPVTARLRIERSLARKEIKLAKAEVRVAELVLRRKVSSLFDKLEITQAEMALLVKQITLSSELREFLEIKVERAEASPLDVRRARLVSASLHQEIHHLEHQYQNLLDELKRVCGFNYEQAIEPVRRRSDFPDRLPEYKREEVRKHPSYLLKEHLARIASDEKDIAVAKRWEDIAVAIFFEEGYGKDEPVGFEREHFLGVSVSIPVPLYNRKSGSIRSARVSELQLAKEVEGVAFELLSRAESQRLRYQDIQQQISKYETELIEPSEENLSEIQDAYASGLIDLTEVFRAQEQQLELRLRFLELKAERSTVLTEWHYNTAQF